jgi:hypothetical protein
MFGVDSSLLDTKYLRLALWSGCVFVVLFLALTIGLPRPLAILAQVGLVISAFVAGVAAYVWAWSLAHSAGKPPGRIR